MMKRKFNLTPQRFLQWTALALTPILLIAVLAIWQSRPDVSQTPTFTSVTKPAPKTPSETESITSIPAEPDSHYPAPAKKLHKLIAEASSPSQSSITLDQRIKALNQQVASLNQQLKDQAITPPETDTDNRAPDSEIQRRLQDIRAHMEQKAQQQQRPNRGANFW